MTKALLKTICIVAGCLNEKGNITELHRRIEVIFKTLPNYEFKLLLIDNYSTDGTREEIEGICARDQRVQAIFNSRNFGHIRSPYHALTQAEGDAIFAIVSDLQVDPEIVVDFIKKWEAGADIVIGIKRQDETLNPFKIPGKLYYWLINKLSEIPMKKNFIGIGLYDRKAMNAIKSMHDPYPYFRGMVFEVGFKVEEVQYTYHGRSGGLTKNNFLTLYDLAMLGICSHSKIPLRIATLTGFISSFLSLCLSFFYLVYKIIYWDSFRLGMAPLVIGLFFFASLQLIFIGILGEYIGFIFTRLQNRPLVFEEKRINF